MPEVEGEQDWSTEIHPCERCGEPVIEAARSSDLDDDMTFDFEPIGTGAVLKWVDNDKLPTVATAEDIYAVHECGSVNGDEPDYYALTLNDIRGLIEDGLSPRKLARTNDPRSSWISAYLNDEGRAAIRSRLFVALLVRGSATVRELANDIGTEYHSAHKRFSELNETGLVRGTGELVDTEAGETAEIYELAVDVDEVFYEALSR